MDFVHDVTWAGRRFKVFVLIDVFTRQCLALVVDTSIGRARDVRVLEELSGLARQAWRLRGLNRSVPASWSSPLGKDVGSKEGEVASEARPRLM
jgi:hypothetical protein